MLFFSHHTLYPTYLVFDFLANEHRGLDGMIIPQAMTHLKCNSKISMFEPLRSYRNACPMVLVICHGEHSHPIPLPAKTPPFIRSEILKMLRQLDLDLPDMTPRRFLRHGVVRTWLQGLLPQIPNPTLSDLHISLSNREHLRSYIKQAKEELFPFGTGWDGTQLNLSAVIYC